MDPNPSSFPILSYVMSRLNLNPKPNPSTSFDIEQPQIQEHPQQELISIMPHLAHPELISSMAAAVSEVSHTRSILQTLGDRPDHESVDLARSKIADADSDTEKAAYEALVQLDEMHEAYEKLLREAEEQLVKMYESHGKEVGREEEKEWNEEANEEVIGILKEATDEGNCTEKVELAGRNLRSLPEAFGRMKGLVSLDISNNWLEVIPDAISGLQTLEELHVSSNLLVSLPDSIGLLLNLKILDVSGNKLKYLPDSISNCRSLVELNASYNELTYLPTNIGHELVNMQRLLVHLNKLRFLPTSVCEMRSLRLLDAHFNQLHGVPYCIGKLSNLESLNLGSNFSDLRELPPSFGDLMNLRELDLSNNQIRALPDTFGRLNNLTQLNLDQNPLTVPPVEIVDQGVQAIKEYMAKRWVDILMEEESKNQLEEEIPANAGWLSRSTSWLKNNLVSSVMGGTDKSPRDSYLDQQL